MYLIYHELSWDYLGPLARLRKLWLWGSDGKQKASILNNLMLLPYWPSFNKFSLIYSCISQLQNIEHNMSRKLCVKFVPGDNSIILIWLFNNAAKVPFRLYILASKKLSWIRNSHNEKTWTMATLALYYDPLALEERRDIYGIMNPFHKTNINTLPNFCRYYASILKYNNGSCRAPYLWQPGYHPHCMLHALPLPVCSLGVL